MSQLRLHPNNDKVAFDSCDRKYGHIAVSLIDDTAASIWQLDPNASPGFNL